MRRLELDGSCEVMGLDVFSGSCHLISVICFCRRFFCHRFFVIVDRVNFELSRALGAFGGLGFGVFALFALPVFSGKFWS